MADVKPEHEAKVRELLGLSEAVLAGEFTGLAACLKENSIQLAARIALALAEAEERGRESERAAREEAERECERLREELEAQLRARSTCRDCGTLAEKGK